MQLYDGAAKLQGEIVTLNRSCWSTGPVVNMGKVTENDMSAALHLA